MPTLHQLARIDPSLKGVAESLGQWTHLREQQYTVHEGGEFNRVLVGGESVVKLPRDDPYRTAMFEGYVVAALQGANDSPLVIPRIIENNTFKPPYYTALTLVPGDVLDHECIRGFTDLEKQMMGERVGTFAAWQGKAMSIDAYREVLGFASPDIPDRSRYIEERGRYARTAETIDYNLADVLLSIHSEYKRHLGEGSLQPSIIGHDDLRAENMAFVRQNDQWRLNGVFDFGLTKPSSPERELRHIAPLGRVALEAAVDSYQKTTGRPLSMELIGFWAIAQAATVLSYALDFKNDRNVNSRRADLQYLLSEEADLRGLRLPPS